MSKNRSMTQLLRVRHLEEEQCRLRLEGALVEEQTLDRAWSYALRRSHALRGEINQAMLVDVGETSSGACDDAGDVLLKRRVAELESASNQRSIATLRDRLEEARTRIEELRGTYLEARVKRMQVEAVLAEQAAREAQLAGRRHQTALDDWFGSRMAQRKLEKRAV
jgi:hypothetical protein